MEITCTSVLQCIINCTTNILNGCHFIGALFIYLFNLLIIISFIFIENKCLSDVIWDLKREKIFFFFLQTVDSNLGQSHKKHYGTCFNIYATGEADVWQSS